MFITALGRGLATLGVKPHWLMHTLTCLLYIRPESSDMWRIGTATKWSFDIMAYIPELYEIYDNEKRGDRPAYLPARLPGA